MILFLTKNHVTVCHPPLQSRMTASIEGADGRAGVPTINTHPPDPMHSSMPDSSPIADEDMGMTDPDRDIDT